MNTSIDLNDSKNYFLEYWKDSFNGIASRRSLFKSFNPRVVVLELLDEITLNKQRNTSNENFFKSTLGEYLRNDGGINSKLNILIKNIIKEFDTAAHRPSYLISLCEFTLKAFDEYDYFGTCINSLLKVLDDELTDDNQEKIHNLTNNIIVEFRLLGYTDQEIYKFLDNLLSCPVEYGGVVSWKFPYVQCMENNLINKSDDKSFIFLSDLSKNLDFIKRIEYLSVYYKAKKDDLTYIFRISGVKNADFKLLDVTYYCPNIKSLANISSSKSLLRDEINFVNSDSRIDVVNAAVKINAISLQAGVSEARVKINNSLDIFQRAFPLSTTLTISKSFIAINSDGEIISTSWSVKDSNPDESYKHIDFINAPEGYKNKKLELIEGSLLLAKANGWSSKLLEICHWLRKAEDSTSDAEKLLYYWIAIESFCSKSENEKFNWFETRVNEKETDIFVIKEVLAKLVAVNYAFELGWAVHRRLDQSVLLNDIKISDELVEKCQLNSAQEKKILLINLINNCEDLESEVDNIYVKKQINFLKSFYNDPDFALQCMKDHKNNVENEIILLYRMRNKIAHDGSNNHVLLKSLSDVSRKYALLLFSHIIKTVEDTKGRLSFSLINAVHKYKMIEERLNEKESPLSVFLPNE